MTLLDILKTKYPNGDSVAPGLVQLLTEVGEMQQEQSSSPASVVSPIIPSASIAEEQAQGKPLLTQQEIAAPAQPLPIDAKPSAESAETRGANSPKPKTM